MTDRTPGEHLARPLLALVTFGPIGEPDGGLAVRAAAVAEVLYRQGTLALVITLGGDGTGSAQAWYPTDRPETESPAQVSPALATVAVHEVRSGPRARWMAELAATAWRLRRQVDGFVVESAMLGLPVLVAGRPVVWDTNECETLHYCRTVRTAATVSKGLAWWVLEWLMVRASRVVIAISDEEAGHWRRLFPAAAAKLLVCDHVPWLAPAEGSLGCARGRAPGQSACGQMNRPPVSGSPARQTLDYQSDADPDAPPTRPTSTVLFVGNLVAKHNLEAARWCITELAPTLPPEVAVVLAGRGTDDLVVACGRPKGVVGLGFVSDIDRLIVEADVCVAPLAAGAGVKTKVLHALSLGQRVVGTPVAFEGIRGAAGCIEVDLGEIAAVVGQLLAHPEPADQRVLRQAAQRQWRQALVDTSRLDRQWAAVVGRLSAVVR